MSNGNNNTNNRNPAPHLASRSAHSRRGGGGIDVAVCMMEKQFPEGLSSLNWTLWEKEVRLAVSVLDKEIYDISKGRKKVPADDDKDMDDYEYAHDCLKLVFRAVVGDKYTLVEDLEGNKIFTTLKEKLGGTVTGADCTRTFLKLVSLRYAEGTDLLQHYKGFKSVVHRINTQVKTSRIANRLDHANVSALPDDLVRDFFIMTLDPVLKNDVFMSFSSILGLDKLYIKLLELNNNRVTSASHDKVASQASIKRSPAPGAPVRAAYVLRTPGARGRYNTERAKDREHPERWKVALCCRRDGTQSRVVSKAFLHGKLPPKPQLYIQQILGRLWKETFIDKIRALGFVQGKNDRSLFVRHRDGKIAVTPIHVDDGLVVGSDNLGQAIKDLSAQLDELMGEEPLSLFLGVKISREADSTITLDQRHYIVKLLDRFGFDNAPRDYATPWPTRELLGALLYASISTCPDVSYAVGMLSRFTTCPVMRHWSRLKRVLRYLLSTRERGLQYSPLGSMVLAGFSDADHADDPETRRSPTVLISATEAEYVALSSAVREAIWLRALLAALDAPVTGLKTLFGNNKSSIILAHHPSAHHCTKHIAVHAHFTRERVASSELDIVWVPTQDMVADGLTKSVRGPQHERMVELLGLANVHCEEEWV
ncbi:hypothetical protein JCM3770_006132 [Rhodotorula araucariae]